MIKIKRVYEKAEESDGIRILVDRLWPRGIKKEEAKVNYWLKCNIKMRVKTWLH